ncbi:MAG: tetratricopeptide repeat protein [Myxococcota bacterium]
MSQSPGTRFIGRSAELARIDAAFAAGRRLVTLLGPGGIGKTTLAKEWARQRSGPIFVDLGEARSVDEVVKAVSLALDVPLVSARSEADTIARLGSAMSRKPELALILDNFEQIAALGPSTVGAWLERAPRASFLITSRERLRLSGEAVVEIGPLPPETEGIELFFDRALGERAPSGEDQRYAKEIVARLEGIPLAIELAAARHSTLGSDGLASRLARPLELLTKERRDAPKRQATLRAAIAWSWELLEAAEQQTLVACAAFRGGFSAEAGEALLGAGEALDRLEALRDRSLLQTRGSMRFAMFESIRDFVREKAAADPALAEVLTAAELAHARYYKERALAWVEAVDSRDDPEAYRRLVEEQDNLQMVVDRAARPPLDALAALVGLDVVVGRRGPFSAHLAAMTRVLAEPGASEAPPALLARARLGLGKAAQMLGRLSEAEAAMTEGASDAARGGDRRVEAMLLTGLGVLAHQRRDMDVARDRYERALGLAKEAKDQKSEGRILGNLAAVHHDLAELDQARARYHEALALLRRAKDRRLEGIFLANLAVLEQEQGEWTDARTTYRAALVLLGEAQDRRLQAITLGNLGWLLHRLGELDEAARSHAQAIEILADVGDRRAEGLAWARQGAAQAARGDLGGAHEAFDRSERVLAELEDPLAVSTAQVFRAFLDLALAHQAFAEGRPEEAQRYRARVAERIGEAEPLKGRSDDVRSALALLAESDARASADPSSSEAADDALILGPGGRWFRAPGSEWQDFRRREPIRRILIELVDAQRVSPGQPRSADSLLEAGWPGQQISPEAARNRLHVTLATLRKCGLKDALVSRGEGYLIDPRLRVVWWPEERAPF